MVFKMIMIKCLISVKCIFNLFLNFVDFLGARQHFRVEYKTSYVSHVTLATVPDWELVFMFFHILLFPVKLVFISLFNMYSSSKQNQFLPER